ncbi:hypothetical protein [Phytoactinopolyspora limicola]|uniref:hypothetical protein n=1 Tax=Phytoactinopolyspora limicola TaxID=2715536 RepID=UPI00140C2FC4|nr:hypothetical protein [Phytoactinopolyspora limicola]
MITDKMPERKRFLAIYYYLHQAEMWIDRNQVRHDISEMSVRYKANCIAWAERRAKRWAGMYEWGASIWLGTQEAHMTESTVDHFERQMHEEDQRRDADPVTWLRSTPLIARLIADVEAGRGGTDGDEPRDETDPRCPASCVCRRTPCAECDHEGCGWCPECHPEVPEWTTS